jgi:hypothetical protein
MKTIKIIYESVEYKLTLKYIEAFPNGYFQVHWDDCNLISLFNQPIYIVCKNHNSLHLPYFSTLDEASFHMKIANAIFEDQFIHYCN